MSGLALVVMVVGFLVAFSRSGVPRQQRLPWHEMGLGSLVRQAIDGASRLSELHSRR